MDGLWTVEFASTVGYFGAGVAVFGFGTLLGGDSGYTYVGNFSLSNGKFKARINVEQFVLNYPSVFGPLGTSFVLILDGNVGLFDGAAHGHVEGMPQLRLSVKLRKKS